MQEFENCLGKHTDSLEYALNQVMREFNAQQGNTKTEFAHDSDVTMYPGRF